MLSIYQNLGRLVHHTRKNTFISNAFWLKVFDLMQIEKKNSDVFSHMYDNTKISENPLYLKQRLKHDNKEQLIFFQVLKGINFFLW